MSGHGDVLGKHRQAIRSAAARHNARSIALVESVARGDDTETSDYDFLTDFLPGTTLFDIATLKVELEDLLGRDVDVVYAAGTQGQVPRYAEGSYPPVSRTDEELVVDILEASRKLAEIVAQGREYYDKNWVVRSAVERQLDIIVVAASDLSEDMARRRPALPIREAKAMRNLISHEYTSRSTATSCGTR